MLVQDPWSQYGCIGLLIGLLLAAAALLFFAYGGAMFLVIYEGEEGLWSWAIGATSLGLASGLCALITASGSGFLIRSALQRGPDAEARILRLQATGAAPPVENALLALTLLMVVSTVVFTAWMTVQSARSHTTLIPWGVMAVTSFVVAPSTWIAPGFGASWLALRVYRARQTRKRLEEL